MKYKVKHALTKNRQSKEMENFSKDNFNALPNNVTIREEFTKCVKLLAIIAHMYPYHAYRFLICHNQLLKKI